MRISDREVVETGGGEDPHQRRQRWLLHVVPIPQAFEPCAVNRLSAIQRYLLRRNVARIFDGVGLPTTFCKPDSTRFYRLAIGDIDTITDVPETHCAGIRCIDINYCASFRMIVNGNCLPGSKSDASGSHPLVLQNQMIVQFSLISAAISISFAITGAMLLARSDAP